jgi:PAS domain S-box-containing protein
MKTNKKENTPFSTSPFFLRSIFENSDSKYWEMVGRIGSAVRSAADLGEATQRAARDLGRAVGALRAVVVLLHESGRRLSAVYSDPLLGPEAKEGLASLDEEILGLIPADSSTKDIAIARDAKLSLLARQSLNGSAKTVVIKTVLLAPVILDSNVIGAIMIYQGKRGRRSGRQGELVQAVATSLSLAVYRLRSQEREKAASDREALTNRLLTAIRTAVGVREILNVAAESLGAALGMTRAVIYLHSAAGSGAGSPLQARAEYRSSVLVPSLLESRLDIEGSPVLARLLAGEIIVISDTVESHPVIRAIGVRLGVRALALAPIAYNGQMVGTLTLEQFERPRELTTEEVRLLSLVAEQTAVALCQADLYREAQEAARREALISRITSALHSSLDSDAVLQTIVNELGAALSVCRCRLALMPNPLPESIAITHEYVASCCEARHRALQQIPVRDNPHLQAVFSTDVPVFSDDVMSDPRLFPYREQLKTSGVRSILSTVIRLAGRPIGFFSLHHCERRHSWTRWEVDVVQSVAEQAAVAIRQAELYREARESATGAALVNQIVAAIRRSLDLEETLQVAAEELGRSLGADRTYFRKHVGDQNIVVTEYVSDPDLSVRQVPVDDSDYISTYLNETRRTLIIDDVPAFIAAHPDIARSVRIWQVEPLNLSQIVCPIFVNDQFWGALAMGQTSHVRRWTASEIALVEVVTAQIEVAVSHSHLFEEAKRAARREALISRLTHKINQSNRLDEIFSWVARELGDHLGTDRIVITKINDDTKMLSVECQYSQGEVTRPGRSYPVELLEGFLDLMENGLVTASDVETDPRFEPYLNRFMRVSGTRAFMATHLYYKGTPRYSIAAVQMSGVRAWTAEEKEIMRAATEQVFTAFERAELFEQVSRGKYEWEATFDALNDGILIFDQHGLLRRVNQAGAAFEGEQIRDLIGRKCCTLMQGIETDECRVAQVIKSGRPVTFELIPQRLSRPVLVTISPLMGGSRELPGEEDATDDARPGYPYRAARGAVCIVRDLSELRAAEAVAREQRSFLVKLIEHANDAIFASSPDGRLIWFNEQLTKLSGYSREELLVGDYRRFLPADEKKVPVERFARALSGQAQTFEMHGLTKQGEARLLLVTYTPIYDEDRVTSVLSIARDITEERLASERAAQADKLRALGQLASGVAHNFNNILAAILGHAQLIRRICKEPRALEGIDIIERAAIDGAQTVKRIQGFGLKHSDSINESVDINNVVQDSATLTRARWCDDAQARSLHYEVEMQLQPVPLVLGSASELREVFVNIILNALDAMPAGGRLRIETEAAAAWVKVLLSDTGIGISKEVRERIFEPFFTTKGVSGMGLGLAVSYSIIERHGGRIEVRNNTDRGSTFIISLPAVEAAFERARRTRTVKIEAANVLVVDDDERVREAVVGMLEAAGHNTLQAATGPEALEKMESGRYDLIFTDLAMPGMDGWAVAGEVRRRWPDVKIVLMTGYAVAPETVRQHRTLVNKVIVKPIRLEDISAALSQVLSR